MQAIAVIAQHDWHWYYAWLKPIVIVAIWCVLGAVLLIGATITYIPTLNAPTWHELTYTGRSILCLLLSLQAGVAMLLAPLWIVMEINSDRQRRRLDEILSTPLPASGYIWGKLALPLMTCVIITQSLLPIEIIVGARFCIPPMQVIGASVALIPYLIYTIGIGTYIALLLKALPLAGLATLAVIWLPVLMTTTPALIGTPVAIFNPFSTLAYFIASCEHAGWRIPRQSITAVAFDIAIGHPLPVHIGRYAHIATSFHIHRSPHHVCLCHQCMVWYWIVVAIVRAMASINDGGLFQPIAQHTRTHWVACNFAPCAHRCICSSGWMVVGASIHYAWLSIEGQHFEMA
ncbi:TPA: hypothetical protein EYP84_04050 [Candidatus Bipolaricaulota bacterium]|nr:hypothetical protein [Candidatus Bipolaricaulota bacterium]